MLVNLFTWSEEGVEPVECFMHNADMSKRITLRDVAQESGVSVAAASLALRDSPKLPVLTRERIRNTARKLGYQFDPMLAALASHRWSRHPSNMGSTIAVIADGNVEGEDGIRNCAAAHGYLLEVFQLKDYSDPKRLADVLYNRGILGVIVSQIFSPGFCAAFDWSRFVAVACSEGYERPPVHLVMPNHFKAVQEAWDRAWASGHRRIGLALLNMPNAIDYHERCAAFMEREQRVPEAERLPICLLDPLLIENDPKAYACVVRKMADWLLAVNPDAVLGFNSYFYWIMQDAERLARKKAVFYDLWIAEMPILNPGMYLPHFEIGRRTVEFLDTLIRGGERGISEFPATIALNFSWREPSAKPYSRSRTSR